MRVWATFVPKHLCNVCGLDRCTTSSSSTQAAPATRNAEVKLCKVRRTRLYVFRKTCLRNLHAEPFVQSVQWWRDSQPLATHSLHKLPETPEVGLRRVEWGGTRSQTDVPWQPCCRNNFAISVIQAKCTTSRSTLLIAAQTTRNASGWTMKGRMRLRNTMWNLVKNCAIWYGRGYLAQFWLLFHSNSSFGNYYLLSIFDSFPTFPEKTSWSVDQISWILCGGGYLAHFGLFSDSDPSFRKHFFNFIRFFAHFFHFFSWKQCGQTFDIKFSGGAAISLNFDCFPILTRVSEIHFKNVFSTFSYFLSWI